MEKLIELLNEREIGEEGGELYYLSNGVIRDDGGNILYDYRIISKEYGFIKWLVENDKIDTFRILEKRFDTQKGYEREHYHTVNEGNTDLLLMLLSISDTPIEDLISYLK